MSEPGSKEVLEIEQEIASRMNGRNNSLSEFATSDEEAYRLKEEPGKLDPFRQKFADDINRVLWCPPYKRLAGKTQVHSFPENPAIATRLSHAQELARIAREGAKALGLNEDLIEAVALGHDLGHVPFGHVGEKVLSDVTRDYGLGEFHHSSQSLRVVDSITHQNGDPGGTGLNLTWQVRNGILFHDGESKGNDLSPNREMTEEGVQAYLRLRSESKPSLLDDNYKNEWMPATLEGVLLRVLDKVSYVGADIEDAISVGLIKKEFIPTECVRVLGVTNRQIIESLFIDLVKNSYDKDQISFSDEVYSALEKLFDFDKKFILSIVNKNLMLNRKNENLKLGIDELREHMKLMFDSFLVDLELVKTKSAIFGFLNGMDRSYIENTKDPLIVRDFMAGFTDKFFLKQFKLKRAEHNLDDVWPSLDFMDGI